MSILIGSEEAAMRRALDLAARGLGKVEPNPMVGAVIVDPSGKVLGEGWHREYGGPHAEVHALAAAGEAARGAVLYVTLEPCCHFGKTPPCSRAVIAAGIRKVVIAATDPAPHVNGGGIRELRAAGIEVEIGLLGNEGRQLIAPFVHLTTLGRPWFVAKWAMTLDGKIATHTGHSQWITNESSRSVVHQLRGRMDGVLVGIGTALADDPQLTARPAGPRVATRIVVDSRATLPVNSKLVQTARELPVLVFVSSRAPVERCDALREAAVDVVVINETSDGVLNLVEISAELGRRRMTNVLIEGGGKLLGSFFDQNLIDEVHAFVAPKLVGGERAASPVEGIGLKVVPENASLIETNVELLNGDIHVHGRIRRA